MTFSTLIYEVGAGVARVTLNRPTVLNTYNTAMRDELSEVLSAIRDDPDIRVMTLSGAGRAFCAGADLTEFGTSPSPIVARRIRFARDVWAQMHELPVPSIAALHGFVLGSGLEMALFCDIRVAAESAVLGMPETQLGLIPGAGGTQTLPRIAGQSAALDLLLTGRRLGAREAQRLGIVSEVVPDEQLQPKCSAVAAEIADLDPVAVRSVKRAVREGLDLPLPRALELELRLANALAARDASGASS
jgi:enoyl-CoA hydratase/carnithine racemase